MPSVCHLALYGSLSNMGGQVTHGWQSSSCSDITFNTFCVFTYSCVSQDATHLIRVVPEMLESLFWPSRSKSSCFVYVFKKNHQGPHHSWAVWYRPTYACVFSPRAVQVRFVMLVVGLYFPKALLLTQPCCWVQTVSLLLTVICIWSNLKQGETVDECLIF